MAPVALLWVVGQSVLGAPLLWSGVAGDEGADVHVAFRASFRLSAESDVECRQLGASWFASWMDGKPLSEGPARFPLAYPEFQTIRVHLTAGAHVLAFQVHNDGVATRTMPLVLPFIEAAIYAGGREIPLDWRCMRLNGYAPMVRRINPQLGWSEWCDTRSNPPGWQSTYFDDRAWPKPVEVKRGIGTPTPLSTANTQAFVHSLEPIAQGELTEAFGYERDDPPVRFFLRDLAPAGLPSQGIWRRYDLGRVRLGRPRFLIDAPSGSIVEFAYSEALTRRRVAPWITLSGGDSCNLDHYVARGGPEEFEPLSPRGGRYLEVHILAAPPKTASGGRASKLADLKRARASAVYIGCRVGPHDDHKEDQATPAKIRIFRQEFVERAYYSDARGEFRCNDPMLNRIWAVGVETHRACAEDSLIDNPTRERGQWTGDVVTVGLDVASSAFADLRLVRRGLVQSAQCARSDGLVAGMSPGQDIFLSTYAAQWVSACVHFWEMTGERSLLTELGTAAERNIGAFEAARKGGGVPNSLAWAFVDWGYVGNPGSSDMAVNFHYLAALRDMARWRRALGDRAGADRYRALSDGIADIVTAYLQGEWAKGGDAWTRIGFQRAALALELGLVPGEREAECISALKAHILGSFPNDPRAPRLADPGFSSAQLITPYFAHFALAALAEHGEMAFVLDQYRRCWGWMLQGGFTTWLEVFDPRWSHCHEWSACPTWQLSRYVLGMQPRFDLGTGHYVLRVHAGSLTHAEGSIPVPGRLDAIHIRWSREGNRAHVQIEAPIPIVVHMDSEQGPTVRVGDRFSGWIHLEP